MKRTIPSLGLLVALPSIAGTAFAQTFSIDWFTIDGGGVMQSTGGSFELSGTIGQPDANDPATALTGGDFTLVGGFWAVAVPTCGCLSDVNNDGIRDGLDVQGFANCLTAVGANCACADLDGSFTLDTGDVSLFVNDLLLGGPCP